MNLSRILFVFLLFSIISATPSTASANNSPVLVPKPSHLVWGNQTFQLDGTTALVYQDKRSQYSAEQLYLWLNTTSGFPRLPPTQGKLDNNRIYLKIDNSLFKHDEAYRLKVEKNNIEIIGASEQGLFYGVETFKQLLPNAFFAQTPVNRGGWQIPSVLINDQPRFQYRGMHLDVSRHFFDVEFVKLYIDWLAAHKMNVFQWHLTDDQGWRIEIKKYPKLTEVGSQTSANGYRSYL